MTIARSLPGLPPHGPLALSFPDPQAFREGFVVAFTQSDGCQWIGNFAEGFHPGHNSIHPELGADAIVVVAGGAGYLANADSRLVRDLGWGISNLVFVPEIGAMVTSNGLWLEAFDADGRLWRSRRLSWDGVRDIARSGLILTGEAYDPMQDVWAPFRADLSTGEVEGGSYNGPEEPGLNCSDGVSSSRNSTS